MASCSVSPNKIRMLSRIEPAAESAVLQPYQMLPAPFICFFGNRICNTGTIAVQRNRQAADPYGAPNGMGHENHSVSGDPATADPNYWSQKCYVQLNGSSIWSGILQLFPVSSLGEHNTSFQSHLVCETRSEKFYQTTLKPTTPIHEGTLKP